MPRATNNIADTQRHDLASCPDGYVVLRRMSYGQMLQRQQMAMDMQMEMASGRGQSMKMDLGMATSKTAEFDFANCVAEHNLTDENDAPLDFRQAADLHRLDPRVGQEIGDYIDAMNNWQASLPNSPNGSTRLSPTG